MKTSFTLHILLFTAVVFLSSCVKEGPAGVAGLDGQDGQDGTDGRDGNATCMACHTGTTLAIMQFQYAASTHKAGTSVSYAGGRAGCAECHSSEGFIEFQTTGGVASDISMPSAINCETCHTLHYNFEYTDYELRSSEAVVLKFDETTAMDLGDGSNLCINCHQTRRGEPNFTDPGETFYISSTHYGPHHGPQANVLAGIGFAEIEGPVDYPVVGSSKHLEEASCTVCHMGEYAEKQGGHTWKASLTACKACHETESYDFGGVQFDTEEKLIVLRDLLIEHGVVEWVEADEAYEPIKGTYPMVHAQAFFNWIGLEEDRSLGVHNPQYVNALLTNSIEALKVAK